METIELRLRGENIALCDLLKLTGVANSGGQGKLLVANGDVTVDGQSESRKSAKIRPIKPCNASVRIFWLWPHLKEIDLLTAG